MKKTIAIGAAYLSMLNGACAPFLKGTYYVGQLREEVLQGVWNQPPSLSALDREIYAHALTDKKMPKSLGEKAQDIYAQASAADINEFLEARKNWFSVAHRCYPNVLYKTQDKDITSKFLSATFQLMKEHGDLADRGVEKQNILQSYIGTMDVVWLTQKRK